MSHMKVLLVLTSSFMLFGCQQLNEAEDTNIEGEQTIYLQRLAAHGTFNQLAANQAKEIISYYDGIKQVRAVNHGNTLIVALQIKEDSSPKLEEIRNEVIRQTKENFAKIEVIFSTDPNTFLEVSRLEKALTQKKLNQTQFDQQFTEIKELAESDRTESREFH